MINAIQYNTVLDKLYGLQYKSASGVLKCTWLQKYFKQFSFPLIICQIAIARYTLNRTMNVVQCLFYNSDEQTNLLRNKHYFYSVCFIIVMNKQTYCVKNIISTVFVAVMTTKELVVVHEVILNAS